tara:strand:- start:3860 stop:4066 length:207 start_codon:yes stop_codon:yes gene_type:complete
MKIWMNKRTGAIRIDNESVEDDRILEMLREMVEKITHIKCPDMEDDDDSDRPRVKYTNLQEERQKERF